MSFSKCVIDDLKTYNYDVDSLETYYDLNSQSRSFIKTPTTKFEFSIKNGLLLFEWKQFCMGFVNPANKLGFGESLILNAIADFSQKLSIDYPTYSLSLESRARGVDSGSIDVRVRSVYPLPKLFYKAFAEELYRKTKRMLSDLESFNKEITHNVENQMALQAEHSDLTEGQVDDEK